MSQSSKMTRNKIGRFLAGLLPAAGLTFGLFWGMNQLVDVKSVQLNEVSFRPLVNLTPPEETAPDETLPDRPVLPVIVSVPPPKTPEIVRLNSDDVTISLTDFRVPETTIPTGEIVPTMTPVRITDREVAIPVRVPMPDYPERALRSGLEGECEVVFSIDAAGRPFGAQANCSHQVFERSSQIAVERALFATKVNNGVPIGQDGLVYPIQFTLNE